MKSRLLVALVATALIGATAFAGTTLARNGHGHGHGHVRAHTTLFTVLTGRAELNPTTGQKGAGDPDGLGSATILVADSDTVCFGITVKNLDAPVAAHIHRGRRNENGPIVIPLTPPSGGNPGTSSGCVDGVAAALTTELSEHPNRFYVNVHTTAFPGGAIRGQL